jgi:hypothetical protein
MFPPAAVPSAEASPTAPPAVDAPIIEPARPGAVTSLAYPSSPPHAAETTIAPAAAKLPDSLTPPAEPEQSRRGLLLGIAALMLIVGVGFLLFRLLGGGGTATGAGSPEQAVQQMIDSMRELDSVGFAEILDPDELDGWVGSFTPAVDKFESFAGETQPATEQFDAFIEEFSDAVSVAISGPDGDDITYDVQELDPRGRISRVRIEGLDVTISVNEGFDEALIVGPPADLVALDLAAVDGASLTIRDQLGGLDVRGFAPEQGSETGFVDNAHLDLVTVEKDGSWYISIGYSILENIQNDSSLNLGRPDYGRAYALVDSGDGGGESPEDVVRQMMTAMEGLDYDAMIALTDPMSMPYLHDFQPAIDNNVDQRDIVEASQELDLSIDTLELGTTPWNERTLVTIDQIGGRFAEGTFDLDTTTWCASATSQDGEEISGCLEDAVDEFLRDFDETSIDPSDVVPEHLGLVVIERNGRWFFDPLGSMGYYMDQVADTAADLDLADTFAESATPVNGLEDFLALSAPIVARGETITSDAVSGQAGVAFDLDGLGQEVGDFDLVQIALARVESDGTATFLGYEDAQFEPRSAAATEWSVVYDREDSDEPTMPALVLETNGPITVTLEEPIITTVDAVDGYSGAIDADGRPQILVLDTSESWSFSGDAFYETVYSWDAPGIVLSDTFYSSQFGDPGFGSFAVITGAPGATFDVTVESFNPPIEEDPPPLEDPPPTDEPLPPTGDPRADRFVEVAVAGLFTDFSFDQQGGYFDGCGPDDPDVRTWAYSDEFGDLALVTPYPSEERAQAAFQALTLMTAPCDNFPDLTFDAIEVGPDENTVTISFSFDGGDVISWERYGLRGDTIIATTSSSVDWLDTNWSRLSDFEG